MKNFIFAVVIGISLAPSGILAEEQKGTRGQFYSVYRGSVEFYIDGQRHYFYEGKTDPCNISVGSVVVAKYKSGLVYNAALFAFKYEDGNNWLPITRNDFKVLDNAIDPKNVTAEMISNSTQSPKGGRLGKGHPERWKKFNFPMIHPSEWSGVSRKNEWCLYGYVVLEEDTRPLVAPRDNNTTQQMTQEQLSGIVVIEGDKGAGSGFLTYVDHGLCVVTNLHVLGNNTKFTIKTLSGQDVKVDAKKIMGAVDADIALLGVAEGQESLFTFESSKNVLETTKIGNKIAVVGNRLGGGVATQTMGHIMGIGPTRVEVDAQFQSGNSGSPIYDLDSAQVVGVASYTETIPAEMIASNKLKELNLKNEVRWFGYRMDTVKKWQPISWSKWRKQVSTLEDYHNASTSGLTVFQGKIHQQLSDDRITEMVNSFKKEKGTFGHNKKTAELLSSISRYLSFRKQDIDRIKFYDYFNSCPYWSTNVPRQKVFRENLIEALDKTTKQIDG